MTATDNTVAADINILSAFLSDVQLDDLSSPPSGGVDCIVICASVVLYQAEILFATITRRPSLAKCLVLCGGVGHSTELLYEAVRCHPRYYQIWPGIRGLPEARVLERIMNRFFDPDAVAAQGCRILIEDQSTNCGLNACFTRKLLDKAGLQDMRTCIILQDPTMMLRTRASFEKIYEDGPSKVSFISCPLIVPQVKENSTGLEIYALNVDRPSDWTLSRFCDLLLGEIPRLRDDINGYGPKGRGFISHVDVPVTIEEAWSRLAKILGNSREIR
ncbi:hypothetical protein N7462_007486 [Penicillium macrosclerotiorum]|uniref:uncharacterized protein n=1 Tax=Penicillium macrosclerotiorum TaxID=303699 RepID=UPI0025487D89|nr:uncharacterized protein N7462_007486 [Penicillium macrosclerotiorum]KAJ5679242.1 hypothetical protein N7462_007486 [Penicillium macrosclerotiorum]